MRRGAYFLMALSLIALSRAGSAQQPNLEKGFHADKVYASGDIDHVNTFNGNLNLAIPIGQSYQVSGSLGYALSLNYAGNNWNTEYGLDSSPHIDPQTGQTVTTERSQNYTLPYVRANAGLGWNLSLGRLLLNHTPYVDCTGCMLYQSADGGEHQFYASLHDLTITNGTEDIAYTRDGTYLRLRKLTSGWTVDFPNGQIHEFNSSGRLTRISDAFGNEVNVAYDESMPVSRTIPSTCKDDTGSLVSGTWTISDSANPNRKQYVLFRPRPYYAEGAVCGVNLTAFDGGEAVYKFDYLERVTSRQYVATEAPASTNIGSTVLVPYLRRIELPDGSYYEADYDIGKRLTGTGSGGSTYAGVVASDTTHDPTDISIITELMNPGSFTGHIVSLRLPTRAILRWTYRFYTFPAEVHHLTPDPPYDDGGGYRNSSAGVATRVIERPDENTSDMWSYTSTAVSDGTGLVIAKNAITDPKGTATITHFSVCRNDCAATPYKDVEYGLPIDRTPSGDAAANPEGSHYLSTEIVDGTKTLRKTFLTYEYDSYSSPVYSGYDYNRRIAGETTLTWNDDTSSWDKAVTTYSDFDGLGHYRTATTGGNFASGNVRTTTTHYNQPDAQVDPSAFNSTPSGAIALPAPTSPWFLEGYSSKEVSEGGAIAKSNYWFDASGFLARERVLASGTALSGNDIVIARMQDHGNVIREEYFGGDQTPDNFLDGAAAESPLSTSGTLRTMTLDSASAQYRIDHAYINGVLSSTQYVNAATAAAFPYLSLDETPDANTGLTWKSRDTAGLETVFDYDSMGRITSMAPPGVDSTSYAYSPATDTANPSVTVTTAPSGSTSLQTRVDYDSLGRVRYEWTKQPKDTSGIAWSVAETTYDVLGRKHQVSAPRSSDTLGTLPSFTGFYTETVYDALNRPTKATAPNGTYVTTSYGGAQSIVRTTHVGTAGNPPIGNEVKTTETYDRQGRLVSVAQPTPNPTITATYGYDVGGRLASVLLASGDDQQSRTFVYDNRGFLVRQAQPETEPIRWTYDSRGHVRTKGVFIGTDPADSRYDLRYYYDAAEHLLRVTSRAEWRPTKPFLDAKVFTYATANDGTNYKRGKLETSLRHNYNGTGDVRVLETFEYGGLGGRLSLKRTEINRADLLPAFLQKFEQKYGYDSLGETTSIDYPKCVDSSRPCGVAPWDQLTQTYRVGRLSTIPNFMDSITYHANGMPHVVTHSNGVSDTQELDGPMGRPLTIEFAASSTCAAPSITTISNDVTIAPQGTATLSLTAAGTGPLSYKWFDAAAPITPVATTASFTTSSLVSNHSYYVVVFNSCGQKTSGMVTVTIQNCSQPVVTSQPASRSILAGASATFSVAATGTNLTYQWYKVGTPDQPVSGATSATFATPPLTQTTSYYVIVSNSCGSVQSATAAATICSKPSFATPTVSPVAYNQAATISLSPSGPGPFTYSWFRGEVGDTTIVGTDSSSFITPPIVASTHYWVRVKNACGETDSTRIVVPVALSAPTGLNSTWNGASVTVQWNAPPGGDHYTLERWRDGVLERTVDHVVGTSYPDTATLASGKAYLYRVKAFDVTEEGSSPFSGWDLATVMDFSSISTNTIISYADLDQLLSGVNAVRGAAFDRSKASAVTWANVMSGWQAPVPAVGGVLSAEYLLALRSQMDLALAAAGITPSPYGAVVSSGGPAWAEAWLELQRRAQ